MSSCIYVWTCTKMGLRSSTISRCKNRSRKEKKKRKKARGTTDRKARYFFVATFFVCVNTRSSSLRFLEGEVVDFVLGGFVLESTCSNDLVQTFPPAKEELVADHLEPA